MTISVCISHIYPERRKNFDRLVPALLGSTRPPNEIIVWNNDSPDFNPPGCQMIHATPNPGPGARFLAALCARSDYIFFQGTDLMVQPETLDYLCGWLEKAPTSTFGFEGRVLTAGHPYAYAMHHGLDGKDLTTAVPNHISMGRMDIITRDVLLNVLPDVPLFERHDDIWFSAALVKHHVGRFVVPYTPGINGFTDLPEGGVGICRHPTHLSVRDDLCKQLFPVERG